MKVVVCRPTYGRSSDEHHECLLELRQLKPEWTVLRGRGPNVDLVRATLAEKALAMGADVLLWIDSDVIFRAASCANLVETAVHEGALVGCAYAKKRFGLPPVLSPLGGAERIVFFEGGGILEVERVGLGLAAHTADVLREINLKPLRTENGPVRPWFTVDVLWDDMPSDDFAFCRRVRESGGRVLCDTQIRVAHMGEHAYEIEDSAGLPPRHASVTLEFTK